MALERMDVAALSAAINGAGEGWTAGVTSVSELSDQEKRLHLGAVPPPGESLEEREKAAAVNRGAQAAAKAGAAATAFDLRNVNGQNFITPVKNQENCGSCVAFGSAAAVEGTFRVQRGEIQSWRLIFPKRICSTALPVPKAGTAAMAGGATKGLMPLKPKACPMRAVIHI